MNIWMMLVLLIGAHALCDYPLQGQFLSDAKNHTKPIPGVPWYQALGAHAAIHGAAVALITGIWWLALFEASAHAITDWYKCSNRLDFNQDQAIHIACKILWWLIAIQLTP